MKFTCYYNSNTVDPVIINSPEKSSIYVELGFAKTHLVRLTRFYNQLPTHIEELFDGENCYPLLSFKSKASVGKNVYKSTLTTIYNCDLFDTHFLAIIKKTPNKKTILLLIHPNDGFTELEKKFDVFDNAKV